MKKCILISLIFTIIHISVSGQQEINNKNYLIDTAPTGFLSNNPSPNSTREIWDLQFEFPIEDTTQGIETDGDFIYITNWRNSTFKKYDLQGNIVEYFTIPGVSRIRDLAYDGQYFYGGKATDTLFIMDFNTKTLIDQIRVSFPIRGIAYNSDEQVFYSNNWDHTYIYEFKTNGQILDSIQSTEYGWTYGFAYDGWTIGGPYLWGFSQDGNNTEAILTQYSLDTKEPTGFYKDLAYLATDPNYVFAGGLFTHQNLVSGTVTIGGLIQNDLVFGLELDSISCEAPNNLSAEVSGLDVALTWYPPITQQSLIIGYNIYRNDTLRNNNPVTDTIYYDFNLPYGTQIYHVTTLYEDDLGGPGCESNPSQSVIVSLDPPAISLGGNVIAGQDKMYYGSVNAYLYKNQNVTETYTSTIIDTLGYYFFLPFVNNNYYIHATPKEQSSYADAYVPTYFGNRLHWEDAPTVYLENSIYDANINMIPIEPVESGSGIIQGNICNKISSFENSPAVDILVLLLNESNECISYLPTDQNGDFQFDNLPKGVYNIIIEVVGKVMNPVLYTLNDDISSIYNISFVIGESEILLGIEESLPNYVSFISDLYPNPATNNTRLEVKVSEPTQIFVSLYDARGKALLNQQYKISIGSNEVALDIRYLTSGIYYYQITFKNGQNITRKLLISK